MLSNFLMKIVNTDHASARWKELARAAVQNGPRDSGSLKIEAIKALRGAHDLPLKEAKDMVEYYIANYQNLKETELATYQIERNGVIIQVTQTGADRWNIRRVEDLGIFTHQGLMNALVDIGEGYGPKREV